MVLVGAGLLLTACMAAPELVTPVAPVPALPAPTPIVLVATPTPIAGLDPHELRIIEVYRRYLVGGDILTAIDGEPLASWDDLRAYLDEQTEVSQAVRLTLWRDGQPVEIDVVLGQEPF